MFKYVLKRIGLMIMTFTIVMVISFFLIKALGPPAINVVPPQTDDMIRAKYEARGYYDPVGVQFITYIQRIFKGDFGIGTQMYRDMSVWNVFIQKLPATMLLNVYSMVFAIPIGLALGIYAALKKNKWQDHVVSTMVMVCISVPSFVYAFLIQYVFCFKLGWFPFLMKGGTDYFSWTMFVSIVPAFSSLALGSIAGFCRYTRAELTEVLTNEFMLLARTKGLTRPQAVTRHALRNAMVPIFPMIMGEFIGIIGGSLVIEKIFGVPGVGGLILTAINLKDYDFFMLLSGFYIFIGLLSGILVDLSYGFIDPRIRMGAR